MQIAKILWKTEFGVMEEKNQQCMNMIEINKIFSLSSNKLRPHILSKD